MMESTSTDDLSPRNQQPRTGKTVEERLSHSINQRTRSYVLTVLNEGTYGTAEIAAIIGESHANVKYHIQALLETASIELAAVVPAGNTNRHLYRAIEMPYYSDADFAQMSPKQRQELIGLTLQCSIAEVMSAFWAGKMNSDPRLWLSWRWFNVDERGRDDLADELKRSWERIREIEIESTNRTAESKEKTQSVVVLTTGFPRERSAQGPPKCFKGNAP
jgi:hypothetical protein